MERKIAMNFSQSRYPVALLVTALFVTVAPPVAADMAKTSADVFDQLRALEGAWASQAEQGEGEAHDEEAALASQFDFAVSAGGTVVMETMNAGTTHEMINMYHLDGEDLVLTHYCAAGNQPTMKLDRAALAEGKTQFAFTGGTNLDPAVDQHIHSVELNWQDDGSVAADWTSWGGGEQNAVMHFVLTRSE